MKKIVALTVLGVLAALVSDASAKNLEDVLREKGVITEEEQKEIANGRQIKYKLGEGFSLSSSDGMFSGSLTGLFKIRYSFMDLDDSNDTAAKKAQDSSKFELKGIKLMLNGTAYSRDLTYRLFVNFSNISGGSTINGGLLEETWINYRYLDGLQFRFGQDKVQFGRQFITSATALQFVDQSSVTAAFVPGYDTGLMMHGKSSGGLATYNVGVYGGVGQNIYRSTKDIAFMARITANPLGDVKYCEPDLDNSAQPLMSVGASFYWNTLRTGEANNVGFTKSSGWYGLGAPLLAATQKFEASEAINFNTLGIDGTFKWRGITVAGEYFAAQAEGDSSHHKLRAEGFYAQAGYFVIPEKLELAYRFSYLDPNRDKGDDHGIENCAGVSWYINRNYLKLQADYTAIHKQSAIASTGGTNPTDDQLIRFQAQIIF